MIQVLNIFDIKKFVNKTERNKENLERFFLILLWNRQAEEHKL